ncbi:MAG: hypothetical protein ACRDKS_08975, partial [Actinomycetota bacterium]
MWLPSWCLLAEDVAPPETLWTETLISSRLTEYEIWTRIHTRRLSKSHGESASQLLARISLLELTPT